MRDSKTLDSSWMGIGTNVAVQKRCPARLEDEHPISCLQRSHALCLKAFLAFRDIELYSLAFCNVRKPPL